MVIKVGDKMKIKELLNELNIKIELKEKRKILKGYAMIFPLLNLGSIQF